jgi:hypothetical protein
VGGGEERGKGGGGDGGKGGPVRQVAGVEEEAEGYVEG